jgi:hypothetical protein
MDQFSLLIVRPGEAFSIISGQCKEIKIVQAACQEEGPAKDQPPAVGSSADRYLDLLPPATKYSGSRKTNRWFIVQGTAIIEVTTTGYNFDDDHLGGGKPEDRGIPFSERLLPGWDNSAHSDCSDQKGAPARAPAK